MEINLELIVVAGGGEGGVKEEKKVGCDPP